MLDFRLNFWPLLLVIGSTLVLPHVVAVEPTARTPPMIEHSTGRFVFNLTPKAFQSRPLIDMTVLTEMTDEGKKRELPSPDHPIYFVAAGGGFHVEGENLGEKSPAPAEMERVLFQALATSGYQQKSEGKSPEIAIFYHWGTHNTLNTSFPDIRHANELSRALLVGGKKFTDAYAEVLRKEDDYRQFSSTFFGTMLSPLERFKNANAENRELVDQSTSSLYFVVASAYDYRALTQGKKNLLWRTKMTVDSRGVSMRETLPVLVGSAGPYFGREMDNAATLLRRVQREGRVEVGSPRIVDDSGPFPAKK